jgi:hypothetical protein
MDMHGQNKTTLYDMTLKQRKILEMGIPGLSKLGTVQLRGSQNCDKFSIMMLGTCTFGLRGSPGCLKGHFHSHKT